MIDPNELAAELGCDSLRALPRDVSPREYFRGQKNGRDCIVMLYPVSDAKNRAELEMFLKIGSWLGAQGIKSPQVYSANIEKAYAILEDLGSVSFGRGVKEGVDGFNQDHLYTIACDVLKTLARAVPPENLPLYKDSRIHENRRQIVDYYLPLVRGRMSEPETLRDYLQAWEEVQNALPSCPQGFVHGDFHLENLMLRSQEDGLKKCALIDFQDALYGPLPYDLVNLLEDARNDVPPSLRSAMIARYCEGMSDAEKENFLNWYRVLGTQFHCRVLGLFIKLSAEQGRDQYLIHINRLQNYIRDNLSHSVLVPIQKWFTRYKIDLSPIKGLNGAGIREVFENISC